MSLRGVTAWCPSKKGPLRQRPDEPGQGNGAGHADSVARKGQKATKPIVDQTAAVAVRGVGGNGPVNPMNVNS